MRNNILMKTRRRISISILKDAEMAINVLMALNGVLEVKRFKKSLRIEYDLSKLNYIDLINALDEQNLVILLGRWQRFKISWNRDADIIVCDNMTARPSPCCSNPTSIIGPTRGSRRT